MKKNYKRVENLEQGIDLTHYEVNRINVSSDFYNEKPMLFTRTSIKDFNNFKHKIFRDVDNWSKMNYLEFEIESYIREQISTSYLDKEVYINFDEYKSMVSKFCEEISY